MLDQLAFLALVCMNSLAQRLCSFRAHHVSLYPLNVCKKDARADQQCLLGFVLLQLKIQQLEDFGFHVCVAEGALPSPFHHGM